MRFTFNSNLAYPDKVESSFDSSQGTYYLFDTTASNQLDKPATAEASQMAVNKATKSLNATVLLKTNWGTIYRVTNQKYDSSALIFGPQDSLVFIQSSSVFRNDQ